MPPSWPVGDAYLRQTEAALPAVTYRDVFRDPRLQRDHRPGARQQPRPARRRRQHRRRARAVPHPARRPVPAGRCDRRATAIPAAATARGTHGDRRHGHRRHGHGHRHRDGHRHRRHRHRHRHRHGRHQRRRRTAAFSVERRRHRVRARPVRPRPLAQPRRARPLFRDRGRGARDAADAGRRHRRRLADLCRRPQPAARSPQDTARSAQQQRPADPRAAARAASRRAPTCARPNRSSRTAQADLAEQRTALAQDVNALQLLVGAPVDAALLPASIDEARADARRAARRARLAASCCAAPTWSQAEYELRAANAEIGAARAALFPRISLTGLLGLRQRRARRRCSRGGAFNYSVAPVGQLFDLPRRRRPRQRRASPQAQRDAALATYERAIQTAFREIADALARQGTIADAARARNRSFAAAARDTLPPDRRALSRRHRHVPASLDAQRSLYTAQRTLVATQLRGRRATASRCTACSAATPCWTRRRRAQAVRPARTAHRVA